jgi:hypothetical protein
MNKLKLKISIGLLNRIMFFLFVFLLSCTGGKYHYSKDMQSIEIPLQDMLPKTMMRAIRVDSSEAIIPILLMDKKGNHLKDANFEIDYGNININLKSDAQGIVSIKLNTALINANPLIRISHDDLSAEEIKYSIGGKTVKFIDGKSVDAEVIEYGNLQFIEQDNFRVYYTCHHDTAKVYFQNLYNVYQSVKSMLGKNIIAKVYPLLVSDISISIVNEPDDIVFLPMNPKSWEEMYWFFAHECTENDLIAVKKVYDKNPNIRYIGDGLAEYVSLKILETINQEFANQMLDNRIKTLATTVNELQLPTWTHEDKNVSGYSYSLAFFLKMEKENGKQAVLDFLRSFSALNVFDTITISNLLSNSFKKTKQYSLTKKEAITILRSSYSK